MESGKGRRYHRLLGTQDRTLIVATDDGLISGPTGLLSRMGEILKEATDANGVLMYRGHLERSWEDLGQRAAVVNLTASVKGKMHTEKIICGTVRGAVRSGADWVAAHVNIGSMYENKMIENLAKIVEDASELGVPVLGIMYPREEGQRRGRKSLRGETARQRPICQTSGTRSSYRRRARSRPDQDTVHRNGRRVPEGS